MAVVPNPSPRGRFGFGDSVAAFLTSPDLPFASVLTEERIERVFAKHDGLFGRTYTTAVVLWAFMGQVPCRLTDERPVLSITIVEEERNPPGGLIPIHQRGRRRFAALFATPGTSKSILFFGDDCR